MKKIELYTLRQTMNSLLVSARKFNLYVCSPTYEKNPDIDRAKKEIENIKNYILQIEERINNL